MKAPDTPLHLRLRVTTAVAPYLHPKRAARAEIVVDDPYGFDIDPALAGALWEIADPSYLTEESPVGVPRIDEEKLAKLGPRLAEEIAALTCPEGYGLKEATSDLLRMQKLSKSRDKKQEEEKGIVVPHVLARLRAYNKSPDASGRARMVELSERAPPAPPRSKVNSSVCERSTPSRLSIPSIPAIVNSNASG